MSKFWKRIAKGEAGQVLPIALALLVLGGLTIIPSLGLTFSSAKTSHMIQDGVKGTYAAEAGIEEALWSLAHGAVPPSQLSDNINGMQVNTQTVDKGEYTLYFGELIEAGEHSDYLDVTANMTWDAGAGAYKYTINITWQAEPGAPPIKLEEVGARIPVGYIYEPESAASFPGNLSTDEPDEILDSQGAYMLNWVLGSPKPYISENQTEKTQFCYTTGEGNTDGHYAWVVANREDVGAVGEVTGTLYEITATAIHPENNRTAAKIVVTVVIGGGDTYITSWQIYN